MKSMRLFGGMTAILLAAAQLPVIGFADTDQLTIYWGKGENELWHPEHNIEYYIENTKQDEYSPELAYFYDSFTSLPEICSGMSSKH